MLAVYMPIVREASMGYKDLWNIHRIRRQPNRPNPISGQPQVLYDFPPEEVQSYGGPIDPEFALKIEESIEEWGKLLQVLDFFNGVTNLYRYGFLSPRRYFILVSRAAFIVRY